MIKIRLNVMIIASIVAIGLIVLLNMIPIDKIDMNEQSVQTEQTDKATAPIEQPKTITEQHTIVSIDSEGYVHGENVSGTGEGIYYPMNEFNDKGINIVVGDVVDMSWSEEDYINEVWNVYSVELVE